MVETGAALVGSPLWLGRQGMQQSQVWECVSEYSPIIIYDYVIYSQLQYIKYCSIYPKYPVFLATSYFPLESKPSFIFISNFILLCAY